MPRSPADSRGLLKARRLAKAAFGVGRGDGQAWASLLTATFADKVALTHGESRVWLSVAYACTYWCLVSFSVTAKAQVPEC